MNPLNRLLVADLKRSWGLGLAVSAVLTCGVATFVMSSSTVRSLEETRERYYRDYRFARVFVQLKRAPNHLAQRLAEIPGVAVVEPRVVHDVILDLPTMVEPATCRLVSVPDEGMPVLNSIHLRRGRWPDPGRQGEVIASELFAEAHGLGPGDGVDVIMSGRQQHLTVVGLGMSPEYIYAVPAGQLLPDNRRFGVMWMAQRQMAAAFNMEGAFNDVSLGLLPRASEADVLFQVDRLVRPFGGRGAFGRHDQVSHRRVADEMIQLRGMAFVTPLIFLVVTAFLLHIVLTRLVYHQQEQIATLRAFGYTRREIGLHYVKWLLALVLAGVSCGTAAGILLSWGLTALYGQFFRFPVLYQQIAWDRVALAALMSVSAAAAGGFTALRHAVGLPPGVAMRPESPRLYRATVVERLGLGWILTPVGLMVARQLERNFRSTSLSVLAMALGTATVVLGSFMEDTIQYVMDVQFEQTQRQDVTLTFNEAISQRGLHDVGHLPGVLSAEPYRAAAARLRRGTRQRRVTLMGLEERPRLFRVLDRNQQEVALPGGGLTVSEKLAELLDIAPGDEVEVEFLEKGERSRMVPVGKVFPDYTDPGAYINRHELHRLLGEGECLSGAFLSVDSRMLEELHAALKQTPVVAGVSVKQAAMESFRRTILENLRPLRMLNVFFAFLIAFGVIYNCALVTLTERSRDLATLRVLGFTRREVSLVFLGELAVITIAALPLGLPIGYGLSYLATLALDTETHRFPLVIQSATFAYAASVILLVVVAAAVIVRPIFDRLNLIAVLKVQE